MTNVDTFLDVCQQVFAEYAKESIDVYQAAKKIETQAQQHPFEPHAHPMLYKVTDMCFDIVENYRSEKDDITDWKIIKQTINDYIAGNWEPTCWMLSTMYGVYTKGHLTHSFSVVAKRQNGKTIVESSAPELKKRFKVIAGQINVEQTDQRYLQNLANLVPVQVENLKHMSTSVAEYLTKPYYSTA